MIGMSKYQPGVCNIGRAEITRRKRLGWIGATATVVLWLLLVLFHAPTVWRLVLLFTTTIAAAGFLQAYMHFCAAFGFRGISNMGAKLGRVETVGEEEFRRLDKEKALRIAAYSILVAVLIVITVFVLPF
jgi:hypothetical protein